MFSCMQHPAAGKHLSMWLIKHATSCQQHHLTQYHSNRFSMNSALIFIDIKHLEQILMINAEIMLIT